MTRAPPPEDPKPLLQDNLIIVRAKIKQYTKLISEQIETARALARSDRNAALMALKTKKQHEAQLRKYQRIALTLEANILAIQEADTTQTLYQNMVAASAGLKQLTGLVNLGDVHNMTDDLDGIMQNADELQRALGESVTNTEPVDDDELEAELAALLEGDGALLPGIDTAPPAPATVPLGTDPVIDAQQREARDWNKLAEDLELA